MTKRLPLILLLAAAGCAQDVSDASDGTNVGFGGAQDIGQFRDIIERGGVPGPDTFDASGFFAEHHVQLPAPTCGQPLCATSMLARGTDWLTRKPQTTIQVGVTATVDGDTLPRRPLDLAIVVDRSGSMYADGRMLKVKQGLRLLVPQLREGDRMALVAFDDRVKIVAPWGSSPAALEAAIDALEPGGATNLHDGLRTGLELAESVAAPEREARVLFLSDGLATAGNTSREAILALADTYASQGIGVSTIGVGREFDPLVMRGVAERGAGNFYFLEDAAAVDEVFTEELKVSMTPIALDVRFVVNVSRKYQLVDVAGRSGWMGGASGGTLRIPAAFATSRQGSSPPPDGRRGGGGMLFFDLSETTVAGDGQVATIDFSYRLPGSTTRQLQRLVVGEIEPSSAEAPRHAVSHESMQKLSAMYNLYRGLRSVTLQAANRSGCATETLARTQRGAQRWNAVAEDSDITADNLLVFQLRNNLIAAGYPAESSVTDETYPTTCQPLRQPMYIEDDYDGHYHGMACSSSAPATGLLPLLLGALALLRRRRTARSSSNQ